MSTTFICWPHAQDAAFRAAWERIVTSEALEDTPQKSATHYMIGSSRLLPEQTDALLDADVGAEAFGARPANWAAIYEQQV